MDIRNQILAEKLVNYSTEVKAGENVLIEANGGYGIELVDFIVKEVYKAGGVPFVNIRNARLQRTLVLGATEAQLRTMANHDLAQMKNIQAYIAIRAGDNLQEQSDVPSDKKELYNTVYARPVTNYRVDNTKWTVLTYPLPSYAQAAETSTESYEEFYYNVCNLDYAKMGRAMDNLVTLMDKTDKVRIKSDTTELSFSIKDIPAVKCDGKMNIPDGEVYTAPVRDSVNGYVAYNTPSVEQGFTYENVRLEFKDGKIIKATANDTARVNALFDTDEGARYVGEFALGVNPFITKPAKNILFDEKISGSFHFTPGRSYEDANNGNNSAVHWDLVCIQTPEYGGGEIYFDGVLIRKDGRFVIPELLGLNPENLI
ncbi:aminopeptidase [Clostridia bacterium]|nr:aminopeptidase [Clostridia bacterium]